jgi:hypothetical protein
MRAPALAKVTHSQGILLPLDINKNKTYQITNY